MRFNGWQRLWVMGTLLWGCYVAYQVLVDYQAVTAYRAAEEARAAEAAPTRYDKTDAVDRFGCPLYRVHIDFSELPDQPKSSITQAEEAARTTYIKTNALDDSGCALYQVVVVDNIDFSSLPTVQPITPYTYIAEHLPIVALAWLGPAIAVYVFGRGVRWVKDGFKGR